MALLAAAALPPAFPPAARAQWVVQLVEENDEFCACGDDHYTQGVRAVFEPLASNVSPRPVWRFSLGQTMYTPRDLGATAPILDDRPYAGWLFVGAGRVSQNERRETILEILAGPTGRASFSKETQVFVHTVLHTTIPRGWENQADSQLGFLLFGSVDEKILARRLRGALAIDATMNGAIQAGNVFTRAGAGAQARLGNLRSVPWGGPRPPSIGYGRPPAVMAGRTSWFEPVELYGYARAGANHVWGNFSLDAESPAGGTWVEREPWVGELEAGVALGIGVMSVRYGVVRRSAEFEGGPAQGYGSIAIALAGRDAP